MTRGQAIYNWLSTFGVTAYAVDAVPNVVTYPYMTYDASNGYFGDTDSPLTVNLYYRDTRGAVANAKAEEICAEIGRGGKIIPCDGGAVWLKRGEPAWQPIKNTDDDKIRQRYINIETNWLTTS